MKKTGHSALWFHLTYIYVIMGWLIHKSFRFQYNHKPLSIVNVFVGGTQRLRNDAVLYINIKYSNCKQTQEAAQLMWSHFHALFIYSVWLLKLYATNWIVWFYANFLRFNNRVVKTVDWNGCTSFCNFR